MALSVGSAGIDADRVDVALEALAWAKHQAPRVGAVREAYGVACYLDGDWAKALTELQAYRRMTGRNDQNHLIADSQRGLGRDSSKVAEPVEELLADDRIKDDLRAEAVIVWAGALADGGDLDAARAVLRRELARVHDPGDDHVVRLVTVAAELAERDGDPDAAAAMRAELAEGVDLLLGPQEEDDATDTP
jgi:hypothetical protein